MQSYSDPLNRLHEDGGWFARAHELKLLVVRVSSDLRGAALKLLPQLEFHHDNRSAWVLLEDARLPEDDGWQARTNRLAAHWELRREAFAGEGTALPAVTAATGRRGLEAFRRAAGEVLLAMQACPLEGLVVVLAPGILDDIDAFEQELTALIGARELGRVRYVVVLDAERPPPPTLCRALGERALVCPCLIDEAARDRELGVLLATSEGGRGHFGMAAPPGVVPPPRVDDPPPLDPAVRDEELRKAGINPAMLTKAPALRDRVLGAAMAMKQGRGPEAIKLQREARDLAAGLDMPELKIITQITLASYLSGLGQRPHAIREAEQASQDAEARALPRSQAQAELALGLLYALEGQKPAAARAYTRAARAAEAADDRLMAIESWRLAGQLALDEGQEAQAGQSFREALRVAEAASPDEARHSSAPEAARRLAAICRARGLGPQADALEAQADRFERGEPATAS